MRVDIEYCIGVEPQEGIGSAAGGQQQAAIGAQIGYGPGMKLQVAATAKGEVYPIGCAEGPT